MSDVGRQHGPDRRVEGRIPLDILGVPDAPGGARCRATARCATPGSASTGGHRSPTVRPIDYYEVRDQRGHTQRCGGTSCDITGLEQRHDVPVPGARPQRRRLLGVERLRRPARCPTSPSTWSAGSELVARGDGTLHHRLEARGDSRAAARRSTSSRWSTGETQTSTTSEATFTGLDNHAKYTFRVRLRNAFTIGARPDLRGLPAHRDARRLRRRRRSPTRRPRVHRGGLADLAGGGRQRAGTGALHGPPATTCRCRLHQHPDPRLRQRQPGVRRHDLPATPCVATNANGKGVLLRAGSGRPSGGPRASRRRGARWSVLPTGNNNQAGPASPSRRREARSRWCGSMSTAPRSSRSPAPARSRRSSRSPTTSVARVMLEVCNEERCVLAVVRADTCRPTARSSRRTSTAITPTINVTRISWTIEVDSNGDEATVTVTSDRGRNETFTVPVGVSTVTTQPMEFGYQTDRDRHRDAVRRLARPAGRSRPPTPPRPSRRRRRLVSSARARRATTTRPSACPQCNTGNAAGRRLHRTRPVPCSTSTSQNCRRTAGRSSARSTSSPQTYGPFDRNGVDTDRLLLRQARTST